MKTKHDKIVSLIIFTIIMWFLIITALFLFFAPAQASTQYAAFEAMTPAAIERKRVEGILNE